ncbi:MAG TPA: hypothetical protein VIM31_03695 [Candidatus Microsaccharimonas sp.]|jgi:hypothetical protein
MGNRPKGPGHYEEGGVWVPDRPSRPRRTGSTAKLTSFRDKPQRDDPSVTNTYFNSGAGDDGNHGHVKSRENLDGTTDYLFARDVDGTEYDV